MKGIVVINGYPKEEKFIRQGRRIADELKALGVEVSLLKNGELYATVEEDGNFRCQQAKGVQFAVYLDKDKYLGYALEGQGIRLFNSPRAVELCDDKMRTYQALSGANVKMVKSIAAPLCYTKGAKVNEAFCKAVATELGFPLVAKTSYGSFGNGVRRIHGYPELVKAEQELLFTPHLYQAYIAESSGRDIRVLVIGGKAVAAMERVAKAGEFRSNVELGGKGRKIALPAEYKAGAERAAKFLGLDYCGVDLLEGKEGAILCEVNSNAFFEGMEEATGVNIARLYAEYIVRSMSSL